MLSLEYIAGLIDCDGSLCISYKKRDNAWSFVVNFRQLEKARPILEELQSTLQVGKIYYHSGGGPQKMLTWQTTNIEDTRKVCHLLRQHLRIKQTEATQMLLAISFWRSYKKGLMSRQEADSYIDECISKMNLCNQTGRIFERM